MTPMAVKKALSMVLTAARQEMAFAGESQAKVLLRRHKFDHEVWIVRVQWPDMVYRTAITKEQLMRIVDPVIIARACTRKAIWGAKQRRRRQEESHA